MNRTDATIQGTTTRTRRGSAIIVVIGALALVAVFAALYVTIGQGDQRVAVVAERTRAVSDVDRTYAKYIMGIVARDRLAAYPTPFFDPDLDPTGGVPNTQRFVREATDIPSTDWQMRSQFPLPQVGTAFDPWIPRWAADAVTESETATARRIFGFDPVGDASTPWPLDAVGGEPNGDILSDYRIPSDPWLASTEPTAIVWRSEPINGNDSSATRVDSDGRSYSFLRHNAGVADRHTHPALRWMDNRDWAQITNVAPDGRFVNLFNLRDNFDAEAGIGITPEGDHRMTSRLTLLEPIRTRRTGELRATTFLPNGLGDMGVLVDGEFIVEDRFLNIPAIWSTNQRFMFFPLNQPERFRIARTGSTQLFDADAANWGDYEYPDYQYADADGDGMADARWFELADATDPENVIFDVPVGDTRFFGAARIIDLSALVNVNTATDGLTPPSSWSPMGMTPADVDLRRLLAMTDQARDFRPWPTAPGGTEMNPDQIARGTNAWGNWNLANNPVGVGVTAFLDGLSYRHIEQPFGYNLIEGETLSARSYFGYQQFLENADGTAANTAPLGTADNLNEVAELTGAFAYDAVRRAIEDDTTLRTDSDENSAWFGGWQGVLTGDILDARNFLQQPSPFEFLSDLFSYPPFGPGPNTFVLYNRLATDRPLTISLGDPDELQNPFAIENATAIRGLDDIERSYVARDEYYRVVGSLDPTDASLSEDEPEVSDRFGAELFGIGDLSELLTYRGVNDDRTYSRLERVAAGRYNANDAISPESTLRFTPLRSNRPTALERRTHDNADGYPVQFPASSEEVFGRDDLVDAESMALFTLDPRQRLTTISGASPLTSSVIYDPLNTPGAPGTPPLPWTGQSTQPPAITGLEYVPDDNRVITGLAPNNNVRTAFADYRDDIRAFTGPANLGDYFLKLARALDDAGRNGTRHDLRLLIDLVSRGPSADDWATNSSITNANFPEDEYNAAQRAAMDRLFKVYAEALAPDTELENGLAWEDGNPPNQGQYLWTLHYGNRGPEPALHAAAHLAVNMKDIADTDNQPTAATLLIDAGFNTGPGPDWAYGTGVSEPLAVGDQDYNFQWGEASGGFIFDLDREDNIDTDPATTDNGFNDVDRTDTRLHRDNSTSLADERRALTVFGIEAHPIITEAASMALYIDESPSGTPAFTPGVGGGDLALQVMVFQLHNPFGEPVSLGSVPRTDTTTNDSLAQWDYYIEYNGWYYALANHAPETIGNGTPLEFKDDDVQTLQPGDTRNFVAYNHADLQAVADKWNATRTNHSGTPGFDVMAFPTTTAPEVELFLYNLFANPGTAIGSIHSPVLVTPIDPRTGERYVDITTYDPNGVDMFEPPTGFATPPRANQNNDQVRLWRTYINPDSAEAAILNGSNEQWINNDILVDRMRDPSTGADAPAWDVKFPAGGGGGFGGSGPGDIRLNDAPNEPTSNVPSQTNHLGDGIPFELLDAFQSSFTVCRWRSVRRPENVDDSGSPVLPGLGGVPAYMLEAFDPAAGSLQANDLVNTVSAVLPESLRYFGDFRNGDDAVDYADSPRPEDAFVAINFASFLNSVNPFVPLDPAADDVVAEVNSFVGGLRQHPYENKYGLPINNNSITPILGLALETTPTVVQSENEPRSNLRAIDDPSDRLDPFQIEPELFTSADRFQRDLDPAAPDLNPFTSISVLRVADILRPLAIGPAHFGGADPSINANGIGDTDVVDGEWLTLGEALSIALGFEDQDFYNANLQRNQITGAQGAEYTPLADAVQFETGTAGTTPPVAIFDRGQVRLNDYVPFVNLFNVNSGGTEVRDLPLYQPELGDYRIHDGTTAAGRILAAVRTISPRITNNPATPESDAERATRGLININTAPRAVLRLLPGLTPSLEVDTLGRDEWWAARPAALADDPFDTSGEDTDVGPGVSMSLDINEDAARQLLGLPDVRPIIGPSSGYDVGDPALTPDLWRDRPDVAATLAAYRDRTLANFRFDSREPFGPDNRADDLTFAPNRFSVFATTDFAGTNPRFGMVARNLREDFDAGGWTAQDSADRGRYMMNGLEATRELPGFGSYGELLGAAVAESDPLAREGVSDIGTTGYLGAPLNFGFSIELDLPAGSGLNSTRWDGKDVDTASDVRTAGTAPATPDDDALTLFGIHDIFSLARDDQQRASVNDPLLPRNLATRDFPSTFDINPDLVMTADPYLYDVDDSVYDPVDTSPQPEPPGAVRDSVANLVNDGLANDYDEQLALLAGLANTTDVRSDYFAAWFLIRGYQESDVTGLSDSEPMLPTVERRFLLVLDRSAVVIPGDQPRVLLYRELPL